MATAKKTPAKKTSTKKPGPRRAGDGVKVKPKTKNTRRSVVVKKVTNKDKSVDTYMARTPEKLRHVDHNTSRVGETAKGKKLTQKVRAELLKEHIGRVIDKELSKAKAPKAKKPKRTSSPPNKGAGKKAPAKKKK